MSRAGIIAGWAMCALGVIMIFAAGLTALIVFADLAEVLYTVGLTGVAVCFVGGATVGFASC